MKKNLKRVYKFKSKSLEEKVYKDIIQYLNWKGAYMVFPWLEIDKKGKRTYGRAEVRLSIKNYED